MRLSSTPVRSHAARLLIVLFAGLLGCFASPAAAALTVTITPSANNVATLDPFEVVISIAGDLPPISCFAFTLDYDPFVLQLVSAVEGDLFAMGPHPTFFSEDVDAQGRPVLTDCTLGFQTTVTPPGELARLTFQPLTGGTTDIVLVDSVVRDTDRAVVAGIAYESASVTVAGTAAPAGTGSLRMSPWPNPSSGRVSLRVDNGSSVPTSGSELWIYDLVGRVVRRVPAAALESLAWDGRDGRGREVAGGVYFAILRGQGATWASTKILRVD